MDTINDKEMDNFTKDELIQIGLRINNFRITQKLSLLKFSELLHTSQETVRRYEIGETPIKCRQLLYLSELSGQPMEFFLTGNKNIKQPTDYYQIAHHAKIIYDIVTPQK